LINKLYFYIILVVVVVNKNGQTKLGLFNREGWESELTWRGKREGVNDKKSESPEKG